MAGEDVKWWIESSDFDFDAYKALLEKENFSNAAFHLQQCAEKRLKAVILSKGRLVYTHSILDILTKLDSIGIKVGEELKKAARRLDPHYILSRYPNGIGGSPQRFYDRELLVELEQCMRLLMKFADSNL
jgi:HEPN domain-containing protein